MITETKLNYFRALKSSFLLVFFITFIYRIIDQLLTKKIEILIRSSEGINSAIWIWVSLSLLTALFFPTVLTIVCAYALKNNSIYKIKDFFKKYFELSFLETLRSWGISFLWGLLFIIPGLIKMSYYFLTIFIVLFNPDYAEGTADALKKSEEISKTNWIGLNLIVLLFYTVIPILTSLTLDEYTIFEKHAVTALIYTAIEASLILFFNYLLLKLFLGKITYHGGPDVVNV